LFFEKKVEIATSTIEEVKKRREGVLTSNGKSGNHDAKKAR